MIMGEILFNFYAHKKDERYSKATANVLEMRSRRGKMDAQEGEK